MSVEGIDISKWQPSTPSLAGRDFVIARASIGLDRDTLYPMHAANVRAAGRILGAYHFVLHGKGGVAQADLLAEASLGARILAVDLEAGNNDDTGRDVTRAMIARLQSKGYQVGLYMSDSVFRDLGQDWNWVAKWSTVPPSRPWRFWQYRGSPLDLDRYNGSLAELRAFEAAAGPGGDVSIYTRENRSGKAVLASGAKADGQKIGSSGWEKVKQATGPATWKFDHRLVEQTSTTAIDVALHMMDGPLAGLYVRAGQTTETYDPAPPVYGPDDLAAAKGQGYQEAKTKALAAVQAI